MTRLVTGVASALLLAAAGFFIWNSRAGTDDPVPPAPQGAALLSPLKQAGVGQPPAASERSKEQKRFGRADRDRDGRITLDELLQPRRKAFDRLDGNKDGNLSFEEWTASSGDKFTSADADRSGWLSAREFETTKPKTKARPQRCAC